MVTLVLYGAVMLLAMTMAGLIGFAANVIALPLLSMFMPLELTVSMLVLFAALQSGVQAFRVRHEIHWRELAHILLFIIIGMPIGFFFAAISARAGAERRAGHFRCVYRHQGAY